MKYYVLSASDQYHQNWVFYREDEDALNLRERYVQFQCPSCKKIDELAALASGIDDDVFLQGKGDVLRTHDGFFCVSQRLATVIQDEKIEGLRFVKTPKSSSFCIAMPIEFVEVDVAKAGLQFSPPQCPLCDRYAGVHILPRMNSMTPPPTGLTVFAPNPWLEDWRGKVTWLYASELIVDRFRQYHAGQVDYNEV